VPAPPSSTSSRSGRAPSWPPPIAASSARRSSRSRSAPRSSAIAEATTRSRRMRSTVPAGISSPRQIDTADRRTSTRTLRVARSSGGVSREMWAAPAPQHRQPRRTRELTRPRGRPGRHDQRQHQRDHAPDDRVQPAVERSVGSHHDSHDDRLNPRLGDHQLPGTEEERERHRDCHDHTDLPPADAGPHPEQIADGNADRDTDGDLEPASQLLTTTLADHDSGWPRSPRRPGRRTARCGPPSRGRSPRRLRRRPIGRSGDPANAAGRTAPVPTTGRGSPRRPP